MGTQLVIRNANFYKNSIDTDARGIELFNINNIRVNYGYDENGYVYSLNGFIMTEYIPFNQQNCRLQLINLMISSINGAAVCLSVDNQDVPLEEQIFNDPNHLRVVFKGNNDNLYINLSKYLGSYNYMSICVYRDDIGEALELNNYLLNGLNQISIRAI